MFYRIEILLYRDADDENPEMFLLVDNAEDEDDAPHACVPESGDCIVIDGVHLAVVTRRTFSYDLKNKAFHVMINADRVTRPPRAVNSP